MGEGGRLAWAIMLMLVALFLFFFAFHPGGVANINNPGDMLQFLMNEFGSASGASAPASSSTSSPSLNTSGLAQATENAGNLLPGGFAPTPSGQPTFPSAVTE